MATKVVKEVDEISNNTLFLFGLVTLIIIFIFFFITSKDNLDKNNYYFKASFNNVNGLSTKSKVLFSGLKVGHVQQITLLENNKVLVSGFIKNELLIPSDSILEVHTDGIFGKKHLNIIPGYDDNFLGDNIIFNYTSDSYTLDYLARALEKKINEKN